MSDNIIGTGRGALAGAATGKMVLTSEAAQQCHMANEDYILVCQDCTVDDFAELVVRLSL